MMCLDGAKGTKRKAGRKNPKADHLSKGHAFEMHVQLDGTLSPLRRNNEMSGELIK